MTSRAVRIAKWLAAVVATVLVSAGTPVRGSHTTFYSVKNLGALCWEDGPCHEPVSFAHGVNIFAQVVGTSGQKEAVVGGMRPQAVRASAPFRTGPGGAPMYIGGNERGIATAINGSGYAVGVTVHPPDPTLWPLSFTGPTSFISVFGLCVQVIFGCGEGWAYAINNHGFVVGATQTLTEPPVRLHAFRFGIAMLPIDLGTLGGPESQSHDINDKGEIVGFSENIFGVQRAFYRPAMPGASLQQFGNATLCGPSFGACESFAYAINEGGVIVGESHVFPQLSDMPLHAFRFRRVRRLEEPPVLEDLGTLCTGLLSFLCNSAAYDVNDIGQIVGASQVDVGFAEETHAFLYKSGTIHDLNDLLSPSHQAFYELVDARGINDLGQIVGTMKAGLFPNVRERAYLLTPPLSHLFSNVTQLATAIAFESTSGEPGFEESLNAALAAAQAAVERGDFEAAREQIGAFEDQVEAGVRGRLLTDIQGTKLRAGASLIRTLIDEEERR